MACRDRQAIFFLLIVTITLLSLQEEMKQDYTHKRYPNYSEIIEIVAEIKLLASYICHHSQVEDQQQW